MFIIPSHTHKQTCLFPHTPCFLPPASCLLPLASCLVPPASYPLSRFQVLTCKTHCSVFLHRNQIFFLRNPDWGGGIVLKNPKFPFLTPNRPTSIFYSYNQDTHTDIALYIYRFTYRNTVLLYTTCTDVLYFCEHNSHKLDTHAHRHCILCI